MTMHTQGPWSYTQGDTTVYADGVFVAECLPSSPWADDVPKPVAKANARLIAAAPDLVEALKFIASRRLSTLKGQELFDSYGEMQAKARAALANAGIK